MKMTRGIDSEISGDRNLEKNIEKQMGCMTGFLQLFDRPQTLAGKRLYSAKRLPSSPTADSFSTSERSDASSTSYVKAAPPSPEGCTSSPEKYHLSRQSLPVPLPIFEVRDGLKTSWKLREVPRLSLDSRAVVDARGKLRPREIRTTPLLFFGDSSDYSDTRDDLDKQRRSPSVVARLMGLEAFPITSIEQQPKRSELRRSASESRVSRDLSQFNFQKPSPITSEEHSRPCKVDCSEFKPRNKVETRRAPPVSLQRKSVFDSQEFFPEPKRTGSIYGEIEKRLRMHGIEEPAKDLETLKQILEALHLKGLLRDKSSELSSVDRLNANYNNRPRTSSFTDSQFVEMESPLKPFQRSPGIERLPLKHRSASPRLPAAPEIIPSTRTQRAPVRRSLVRQPEPSESSRSPINSPGRRRPSSVEVQRASQPERRITNVHSPRATPKRPGSDQGGSQSPRIPRTKVEISPKESFAEDDFSTFSDTSIISSPSQFDFERVSIEEYRTGRCLLKRCDKLLSSIAAITSSTEQVTATDQQPSPVSVLDSSFLSDESPASSLPKRSIDFKDETGDWEDYRIHKATPPMAGSEYRNVPINGIGAGLDDDYAYIADVILETGRCGPQADVFAALERRHHAVTNCKASVLHRQLLFDTVTEIIDRKRNVSPWVAFTSSSSTAFTCSDYSLLPEVWEEVQWLQEQVAATENAMELTGKVISQDMAVTTAGEQEWAAPVAEMSGAILHIERQLFKDLVGDTIRELAELSTRRRATALALPCRKLIF